MSPPKRPRKVATWLLSAVVLCAAHALPAHAQDEPADASANNPKLAEIQAQIQQRRSKTALALATVGRLHLKRGRYSEAIVAFRRVAELDPDYPDIQLSLGTAEFRGGMHAEARDSLLRVLTDDPQNMDALFLLALAYIELEELEAASAALERVVEHEGPLQSLALIQLGRLRGLQGDPEGARSALRRAIDLSTDEATAGQAYSLLKHVDRAGDAKRRYRLNVSVAGLYNDNVATPATDDSTGASDGAAEIEAGGSYVLIRHEGLEIETGYNLFQSLYGSHSNFDLQLHTVSLTGSYAFEGFDVSLGSAFTVARLGGGRLLESIEVAPTLEFLLEPWWYVFVGPRAVQKNFKDPDRDAWQTSFNVMNFFFLPNQLGHLQVGLGYDHENADAGRFDYNAMRLRFGLHVPILDLFDVDLRYRYRLRDYIRETASIAEKRLDKTHTIGVRFTRELGHRIKLRLAYEHERSESNLSSADFSQNHLRLELRWAL